MYSNHREIYEKHYKVKLKKNEVIHHKDHNPANNNPENLEKLTKEEHKIIHYKGKNAFYKYRQKQKIQ